MSYMTDAIKRLRRQINFKRSESVKMVRYYYRGIFLSASASNGLLRALSSGPVPLERLATEFCSDSSMQSALETWLKMGVFLGELKLGPEGYSLQGKLSKGLASPAADAGVAFLEQLYTLNHRYFLETLPRLKKGHKFTIEEQQSGHLIARTSRLVEPLVFEAINDTVPTSEPVSLLEIGCGSGTYIHYAASRNPRLTALGLELQEDVTSYARENLSKWGLEDRASVETGSIMDKTPEPRFTFVTLHNVIHYFPVENRIAALKHMRGFLKPSGRFLMTTGCEGGFNYNVNIWSAMTEGCGRLPRPDEMVEQLKEAGFSRIKSKNMMPEGAYFYFCGEV